MAKILVVEDSASTRAFVRASLEDSDLGTQPPEVVLAANGFEAMRLLPRGPYDLIVTDINMGDINGLELIRFIRKSQHHASTPLLIISSQNSEKDVERGLALGANRFLAKPFSAETLVKVCTELLAPGGSA